MLVAPDVPTNVRATPEINTMSQNLPLVHVNWDPPASGQTPLGY